MLQLATNLGEQLGWKFPVFQVVMTDFRGERKARRHWDASGGHFSSSGVFTLQQVGHAPCFLYATLFKRVNRFGFHQVFS